MNIKKALQKLFAKITGRMCCRCRYNTGGTCAHPSDGMYMKCWHSITRPGYEMRHAPRDSGLTEEEAYQLAQIENALQEAAATAQEAGLIDEPAKPAHIARRDAYWDDRAESGLLEED